MSLELPNQKITGNLLLSLFIGLLLLNSWAIGFAFEQVGDTQRGVLLAGQVLTQLEKVQNSVLDMETGQRGYLLVGDTEFLSPFQGAQVRYKEELQHLKELVADRPDVSEAAEALSALVENRVRHLSDILKDSKKASFSLANQRLRLEEGRNLMLQIRQKIREMEVEEQRLLTLRLESTKRVRTVFLLALILTTVLSVAAAVVAARQVRRSQQRLEQDALERDRAVRVRETLSLIERSVAGSLSQAELASNVLSFMGSHLNVVAARFFALEATTPRALATFGTDMPLRWEAATRSLVHEAIERTTLHWVEGVPENYWQVRSSLGQAAPKYLAFLPLRFQNRKLGVLEMGFFARPSEENLEVLNQIAPVLSVALNAAQSRDELQTLLERTQQQAEELEAQQEELRASNEELEQQARAMESQQESLNLKNQELESAQRSLEQKARDLQISTQYKSDFLAKMSHELRTPLNGLLILSTLLIENKEKNLTEQQRQFARSIHSAGNDLLLLINDILDLSKIEARKLVLRPEHFTMASLVDASSQSFAPQTKAKGLELQVEVSKSAATMDLYTDRQRIEQVLRNFLSNALKFTEQGFVRIEARVLDSENMEIAVIDSGLGIPPEKRDLIFQAFEQADGSISRKYGGTGLGLTISRELAQLLGGEITLESRVGEGSRFALKFPARLNLAERPAARIERSPAPPFQSLDKAMDADSGAEARVDKALAGLHEEGKTILIVEDDENFLSSVSEAARGYGFQVIPAQDGELAMAILERRIPDAILLDIKLPGISGLGVLEMIKNSPDLRHIPVHMISGLDYQQNSLRMGSLGYLTKPVTVEKIQSALERLEKIASGRMRKILLIEDDLLQRDAIATLIEGPDVKIDAIDSGVEALRCLGYSVYDCIILDLKLPDMTGFEFLKKLNALSVSIPPIVIYTARDVSPQEEDFLRQYSESIIIKGARSPERLLDEVNLFLHRVEALLPSSQKELLSNLRSQKEDFQNRTVLVVDDDLRNVFALTSALESKNLNVKIAKDGIEALEALNSENDIDLVLMDIMMPRMDGFEAIRRIRTSENERIKHVPVIALTAKAMREDHEKCIEAGANDYISKPVDLEHLTTVLKVWMGGKGFFV